MKKILRVFTAFISGAATFYYALFFVLWADGACPASIQLPGWISLVVALAACFIVGRYVWTRTGAAQSSMVTSIIMGALIMGGIGFVAGFLGPMIFTPENNLGPLYGIYATGPWGFAAGGAGGCIYWFVRR